MEERGSSEASDRGWHSPRRKKQRRHQKSTNEHSRTGHLELEALEKKYRCYVLKYERSLEMEEKAAVEASVGRVNPRWGLDPTEVESVGQEISKAVEKMRLKKMKWRNDLLTYCQEHGVQSKVLETEEGLTIYKFAGTSSAHLNTLVTEVINARLTPDMQLLKRMVLEAQNEEGWEATPEEISDLVCSLIEEIHETVLKIRKTPRRSFLMEALAELENANEEVGMELQHRYKATAEHSRRRWDDAFAGLSTTEEGCSDQTEDMPRERRAGISFAAGQLRTLSGKPALCSSALGRISPVSPPSLPRRLFLTQQPPVVPIQAPPRRQDSPSSLNSTVIHSPSSCGSSSTSASTLPGSPVAVPSDAQEDCSIVSEDGSDFVSPPRKHRSAPARGTKRVVRPDLRPDLQSPFLKSPEAKSRHLRTEKPTRPAKTGVPYSNWKDMVVFPAQLVIKCHLLDTSAFTKTRGKLRLPKDF